MAVGVVVSRISPGPKMLASGSMRSIRVTLSPRERTYSVAASGAPTLSRMRSVAVLSLQIMAATRRSDSVMVPPVCFSVAGA